MQHFNLHTLPYLGGKFELKKVNIAFIFQVNCPGCFIYGIPLMNELYPKFKEKISFMGISTAFEDFGLNTEENTIKLLIDGTMVGETKKYFSENLSVDKYDHKIHFPVAFDCLETSNVFLSEKNIDAICNGNPNYKIWPDFEQKMMREKIISYYNKFELIAKTFTLNQLNGTPSFIIFDNNYFILKSFFGHQELTEITNKLNSSLNE
ncbi:MAG: hypothetical protein CVU08_05995 [Bacteroidetes bacterium HGW-Bacteroidetes-3]|jgi:hypothetical protein|nr:MAG: hypothetical protein CVU08_05995 [Bacteroidetes bacterium HGW-Bacteroidetes-3]